MSSSRNGEYSYLERSLSWQDARDAPSLSERRSTEEQDGYRYVDCSNRKYRNPPVHFSITLKSIDGTTQRTTCHPGSVFEGTINIKLDQPLAARCLKLTFRGSERIHNDSLKKVLKKKAERLFGIQTILWGSAQDNIVHWPLLEAGEHQFPFMCELPMVNYPPTFRHHLASCEFELVACLDRQGIRPFQTVPVFVRYAPYVVSSPLRNPVRYQEETRVSNHVKVLATFMEGTSFNLIDKNTDTLKVQLSIIHLNQQSAKAESIVNHIEASIRREINVSFRSYHQSHLMVMSHVEQSTFGVGNPDGVRTYYIRVPIPSEVNKNNNSTILKNFSVLGMTPTLDFSKHVKLSYKLCITAKIKNGLISNKRELFSIPLHFGTIAHGERSPASLTAYRDPEVVSDTSFLTKPRFIKPPVVEEQLPTYDCDASPPAYDLD